MIDECLVVEFSVTGDDCPLSTATREAGGTVQCEPPQLRRDENALLRFSTGDSAVARALDADDRIRYLHESRPEGAGGDGPHNYRCLSLHPCVVHELTDEGLLVDSIRYRDGTERHTGAVVGYDVLEGVLSAAGDAVGVTIERIYPRGADDADAPVQGWDVTSAQAQALWTAYELDYFAVPKGATATEVADELDISKTAFLERLRRGQANLIAHAFE